MSQTTDDEPALLMAECEQRKLFLNEMNVSPGLIADGENSKGVSNIWYLDNGASNHMTGQRFKFSELDEKVTGEVRFGDGSTVEIKGKGTVAFKCKNEEEKLFREVYYIPNLRNNIISLGQLAEDGNKVVLNEDWLWIYDERGRIIMKVKRSGNRLYKIELKNRESTCLLTKEDETSWLWHKRLGHVNFQALSFKSKNEMVEGMPVVTVPKENCTGCLMAKQARKSFPAQSLYRANKVLELVHGDLCGPLTPETPSGNRYFLLLVDDFSRYMWVYMLREKGEAFDAFKRFKALVESGSDKMKAFRTDRGGEFC